MGNNLIMEIEETRLDSILYTLIGFKPMQNLLPNNVLELSISERIQLVQDIWDSVAINNQEIPVTDSQKQELDRRLSLLKKIQSKLPNGKG